MVFYLFDGVLCPEEEGEIMIGSINYSKFCFLKDFKANFKLY